MKEKRQMPWPKVGSLYGEEEVEAVSRVVRDAASGKKLSAGEEVEKFEREFADYVGAKHAIAVSSCGAGLLICSQIIGLQPGDEVITTPNTHVSTATSVLATGAEVVLADIDPQTFNLDPVQVEAKITTRTRAIYPVHYGGQAVDMDPILDMAQKHGLRVVEDAAHAAGTEYGGRKVGVLGDLTCFSFQTQKNMTTLGEGGMITTESDELASEAKLLRSFGVKRYADQVRPWEPWHYDVVRVATNLRLTNAQAAVGSVQLAKLDRMNVARVERAHALTEELSGITGITTPFESPKSTHVYHIYNILFDEEEIGASKGDFMGILADDYGIQCVVHYLPVYLLTVFRERGHRGGECPVAESIYRQTVGLPLHPSYTEEDIDYLAGAVKEAVARLRKSG